MKILSSASARPNFVKLAATDAACKKVGIEHVIVHTGQHYDPLLSDIFFSQLDITEPKYNLGIKGGGSRETVIADTAKAFEEVIHIEKPDIVLAYGDVNGAVGAARAAKKAGYKLGHIEAGLRSFDTTMPEELNRIEIDQLSDMLFTTEESANENSTQEGLRGTVHFVGNTMIDTLLRLLPLTKDVETIAHNDRFVVATIHRPSNVDDPLYLRSILELLVASVFIQVILPLHPRTREIIAKNNMHVPPGIRLVDPLDYLQFLALCRDSEFIITDSGGIQEEAVILRKKCFTLRRNTERPSTIISGSNELIDLTLPGDRKKITEYEKSRKQVDITIPPLWDGHAGERIVDILRKMHEGS